MTVNNLFRGSVAAIALCCFCGMAGCATPEEEVIFIENGDAVYIDSFGSQDSESVISVASDCEDTVPTEQVTETYEVTLAEPAVTTKTETTVTTQKEVKVLQIDDAESLALSRPASERGEAVKNKKKAAGEAVALTAPAQTIVVTEPTPVKVVVPKAEKKVEKEPTPVLAPTPEPAPEPTSVVVQAEEKEPVCPAEKECPACQVCQECPTADCPACQDCSAALQKTTTTTVTETTRRKESGVKGVIKEAGSNVHELTELEKKIAYGEQVHDWDATAGETLRSLLMAWGEQSGWTVVWKLDRDYHLEAGVVFRGNFTDVAGAIIRSFARATPAPIGTFYKGNRVLVINTQEDENER